MNVENLKVRSQGIAIAAVFSFGWAALLAAIIGLGELFKEGAQFARWAAEVLSFGGISVLLFAVFDTPAGSPIFWIARQSEWGGLVLLPFKLAYWVLSWPGVFIAEKLGLVTRMPLGTRETHRGS